MAWVAWLWLAWVQGPASGEPMPKVALYDGGGRRFELESLEGKVSVLVFGCLT